MHRAAPGPRATTRRLFATLGIAVALVAGLLAMHTLSAEGVHVESAPTVFSVVSHDESMAGVAAEDTDAGHCAGDCAAPGSMPDHSMLAMACVLALLAAVIAVRAPALLARLSVSPGGVALVADAPRASPPPPSLLVLSISRT